MVEKNEILEAAKKTINASIKYNTIRGYVGCRSCDNICMDMHDVLAAIKKIKTFLKKFLLFFKKVVFFFEKFLIF